MSTFKHALKVNDPFADVVSAALGAAASEGWGDEDIGKAVKLGTANNYVLCGDNDEIEGFLVAIEPVTVNAGFSFGSVQRNKRMEALLATGVTGAAVGDMVVAAAQAAIGTASIALVKPGVAASQSGTTPFAYTERTPNTFLWRIIRLQDGGSGDAGETVLLERV